MLLVDLAESHQQWDIQKESRSKRKGNITEQIYSQSWLPVGKFVGAIVEQSDVLHLLVASNSPRVHRKTIRTLPLI